MTYENTNVYWCYNIHYEKTSSNISAKRLRPDQILSTRNGNTGLIHVSVYCRYCGEGKADRCPLCEEDQRAGASPLCLQSASDNRRSCSRKASLLYFLQSHRVISFHFRYNCLTYFFLMSLNTSQFTHGWYILLIMMLFSHEGNWERSFSLWQLAGEAYITCQKEVNHLLLKRNFQIVFASWKAPWLSLHAGMWLQVYMYIFSYLCISIFI